MKSFIESSFFFKGNDPEQLLAQFGSPLYVYNEDILRDSMRKVMRMITKYKFTPNYSIKANSNLTILKIALEEGLNCDAMSECELRLLLHAGFTPDRILFVPNNVSDSELKFAYENGILTSLDSVDQVESWGRIAPGSKIAVRLNPGVGAGHHEKVVTAGKNTKFAITDDQIPALLEVAGKYDLKIVEVTQHIGSLFMDAEPYITASRNLLHMAMNFPGLEFIDFGGGIGVPYHKVSQDEQPFDFSKLTAGMEAIIDDFVKEYGSTPVFKAEPGRFIPCESGVLLGRVYATKNNSGKLFAGTDLGMNILVRPSMYDSWHDIEVIRDGKPVYEGDRQNVNVVGNICETGDIIAKERDLPVIRRGDILCVLDAGAYGYSMSSNYNCRLRPAEVLICSDGAVKLIRRADTFDDILKTFDL